MNFDPFDNVNCKYGAPMGRPSAAPSDFDGVPRSALKAMHQHEGTRADEVDAGYDKGGAYWGLPDNVYAVWVGPPDFDLAVTYVRARSREEAIDKVQGIELDDFTRAYIEALYFTDGQGIDEDEFDGDDMLSDDAFLSIKEECKEFQESMEGMLEDAYSKDGYDAAQAGHDFWLTRNGHGAGFWDRKVLKGWLGDYLTEEARRFGGVHAFKGDDGLVHLEAA